MNIKDSNKIRAAEEKDAQKRKDLEMLELAKKQEALKKKTKKEVRIPVKNGYRVKYV